MDPKQIFSRLSAIAAALSPSQIATIGGAFVLVVGVVAGSGYWLSAKEYGLLFADMDPEAASDIVSRLRTQKVPYVLDQGGRAVRVPLDRVDELRLEFSGQGLPASGRIGFEIFDRTAFGATEFLEQVNYRRALEGEIARTICSLSEVAGARVHVAPAKDSLFGATEQPAKASVVLKLRNATRPLAAGTVQGIASLVAASIEGLRPEAVVIVDSYGRPLSRPADGQDGPLDGVQLERQQRIERDLAAKVVSLLEPVVGPERVRVNVSARINPQSREETEERWDPSSAVIRSRQASSDGTAVVQAAVGVAGARANVPAPQPNAAATPAGASTASPALPTVQPAGPAPPGTRTAETTNFEISRVTRHTVVPRGDIARLSVAVILDDEVVVQTDKKGKTTRSTKSRQPDEIQKIHGLVAAAVGFDATRGDLLTVENVAFDGVVAEEVPEPGIWQQYGPAVTDVGRIFVVSLMGLFAFLFVIRPLMRRGLAGQAGGSRATVQVMPQQLPKTVEELQGEMEAQLLAAEAQAGQPRKMTVLTKRVAAIAQREPENAARLVRTWLTEGEGR